MWSDIIRNILDTELQIWNPVSFDSSAVQYMKYFIYHFTSIPQGFIRTHKWQAPNVSGFIAQLVRASHWYREVTGSNPVESWLFQDSISNCLNCVHNCDDHSLLDYTILCIHAHQSNDPIWVQMITGNNNNIAMASKMNDH